MGRQSTHEALRDPDFRELSARKSRMTLALTLAELALFFGFIALVAWHKEFLALRIGGSATTLGIPIAVGVIVLSWALTGVYVRWANGTGDALARKVRDKVRG